MVVTFKPRVTFLKDMYQIVDVTNSGRSYGRSQNRLVDDCCSNVLLCLGVVPSNKWEK